MKGIIALMAFIGCFAIPSYCLFKWHRKLMRGHGYGDW